MGGLTKFSPDVGTPQQKNPEMYISFFKKGVDNFAIEHKTC